ncbi:MAG: 2OG-Fe(II) oxygenase [Saprospiraceae bacterium]|nr:2OG-Fe(II) oxygenase [Saprospiraceae bacterium]
MKEVRNILPDRKECCLLIKGAFDADFCDEIIATRKGSFKKASTHYPTSYRNNERQVIDTEELSVQLFQEIKKYIPRELTTIGISKQEQGEWKLDSLNTRIRVCRYLPNQYFNKHLDGVHYVSDMKQSKLTFMIYLNGNEDFEGGRTLFFNSKEDNEIIGSYAPEKGDLIIFDHNLWHSGEMVLAREKYILRSDIIYQKMHGLDRDEIGFCSEGHLGYIWTATIFNNHLITSGRDRKIKVWSKNGKKVAEFTSHKNSVLSLIVFDENIILSASRDATIKKWKVTDNYSFHLEYSLNYHEGTVLALCKINDSEFYSGGSDGVLNQINIGGELVNRIKAHNEWIWDVAKIDKEYYATISEDGSIKIWRYNTFKCVAIWKEDVPINSIVIEGGKIFVGRLDGVIIKLEFKTSDKTIEEIVRKKCHHGIIRKLALDDTYLYSASEDNSLKIWTKEELNCVDLVEHKNFVQDIALFDDSIITVSYDGEIHKRKKPLIK